MAKKKSILKETEDVAEKVLDSVESSVKKLASKVKDVAEDIAEKIQEGIDSSISGDSSKKQDSKEEKKAKFSKLLEKAKKLESKVSEAKELDIKKVKEDEGEKADALVPMEDYLKSSIHLGTRVITPDMRQFVYRRRADGLAVFNTALLDDKIREGAEFLSKYSPKDIVIICKREAGWEAVKKFSELTGIRAFTKKYPAGILTNTKLDNFMEAELIFICDPWLDKNALEDANRIRMPVLSICDTNNFTRGVTKIIPGNNKSSKSLGMILYLLTKIYTEKHKIKTPEFNVKDFIEGWDNLLPPK